MKHPMRRMQALAGLVLLALLLGSCRGVPAKNAPPPAAAAADVPPAEPGPEPARAPTPPPPVKAAPIAAGTPARLRELFPHVRADLSAKLIEFDGTVPIDCHNQATPNVYLEVVVCIPDTKEHETLVVTDARPSHIHAALLAAGLQPGAPASWKWENKKLTSFPPRGDAVEVTIAYRGADGKEIESPAAAWIISADRKDAAFGAGGPGWVFAGSVLTERQGREVYDADGSGVVVGLTTFGSETVAWGKVISPDAEVEEPEWIANPKLVPAAGTPVVVRIRPSRGG